MRESRSPSLGPDDLNEPPPSYEAGLGLLYHIWSTDIRDCNCILHFQHETFFGPVPWMAELRLHAVDLNFLMRQGFTWDSRSVQNPGGFYISQEWLTCLIGAQTRWKVARHYFIPSGTNTHDPRLEWRGDLRIYARSDADLTKFGLTHHTFPQMNIFDQREQCGWTVHRPFFRLGHTMPYWWPWPSWQPGRAYPRTGCVNI